MNKHTELAEKLNNAIEALYNATRQDESFHMGVFLHQSINMNADEETLIKIIADVEHHTHLKMTKSKEVH